MKTQETLITLDEIKNQQEITPKKSLQRLIEQMGRLEQNKIERHYFKRAIEVNECKCGEEIEEGKIMCRICEREKKARIAEEKMNQRWVNLVAELNSQSDTPPNTYVLTRDTFNTVIRRENETGDYCEIRRENIWGGVRFSHCSGHALRISTGDYDVKGNMLRKDFGAKELAAGLHKKCNELLKVLVDKRKTKVDKGIKQNKLQTEIQNNFPEANIRAHYIKNGIHYRETGKKIIDLTSINNLYSASTTTYDGKSYDSITLTTRSTKSFTAEQIKSIIEYTEELFK